MERLTPDKIAELCNDLDGKANIVAINRLFREQDESHMWPVNSRFNITDRAIRHAQKFQRESGCTLYGLEYAYFLDEEMGRIVNDERNW
jgi:hypothetical protein